MPTNRSSVESCGLVNCCSNWLLSLWALCTLLAWTHFQYWGIRLKISDFSLLLLLLFFCSSNFWVFNLSFTCFPTVFSFFVFYLFVVCVKKRKKKLVWGSTTEPALEKRQQQRFPLYHLSQFSLKILGCDFGSKSSPLLTILTVGFSPSTTLELCFKTSEKDHTANGFANCS